MKKLLFGLTAAAAMVACAEDIESSNVVGFQEKSIAENELKITGLAFQNVGENQEISLQDFKCDSEADGDIAMWWWDGNKYVYANYYTELYDAEGNGTGVSGWGDDENWVAINKTFKCGDAFWMQGTSDAHVTTSGQLKTTDKTVAFIATAVAENELKQVTNPMPVTSTSLQDIKCDSEADGDIAMWWWTGTGYVYANYYTELYDAEGNGTGVAGWGDDENWVAINKTFVEGEGFWVQGTSSANLLFANPFYTAAE